MGKKLNLSITGTQNTAYDLDKLSEESRDNSSKELVVQVYEYAAEQSPNPANPKLGQIWVSRKLTGSEVASTVKYVSVTGDNNPTITINKTVQYTSAVSPSTASQSVEWASSDESVATIDGNGLATFIKSGSVTVTFTATSDADTTISGSLIVNAVVKPVPTSVSISGNFSEINVGVGQTVTRQLSAAVLPATAIQDVVWSSYDENGAALSVVDSTGLVTLKYTESVSNKKTTIKVATSSDSSITATKVITANAVVLPTAITVSGSTTFTIATGSTVSQYTASVDKGYTYVVWSTSDSSIATVDSDGTATFLKAGSVSIYASSKLDESVSGSIDVEVTEESA